MLFKVLKLLGLDIPAKIEVLKADLESRVERATDHVKQVAQEAAVIAAFSAFAAIAAAMVVGVGLIALYWWTSNAYGPFAGLGVVGAILVVATIAFAAAAAIKSRSLAAHRFTLPRYAADVTGVAADPVSMSEVAAATEPHSGPYAAAYPWAPPPAGPTASASDLVEPLAFLLSKYVKYPSIGNPVVDELIGNLRTTAHGTADEALNRAANVIRDGDRTNLVVVLTGAAFAGWILAHHSRQ